MPLFVAGLLRDRGLASRAVTALLDAGVPDSEISLAVREQAEEDVAERESEAADGNPFADLAVHSAWERLGWLGGARPSYRDRVAPKIEMAILAAGPLAIAIGGAQVGASAGGIVGAMTNFGFTHERAREWYAAIVDGKAWLMVRTKRGELERIQPVMERYRAELQAHSLRHW